MVKILDDLLSDLSVDEPLSYGRLRISPLRIRSDSDLDYLMLDVDGSDNLVTVEETSAAGTVPELVVRNKSARRVLILEGTTLIGAKQNRVVNLSVLLGPESVTVIPVSCVERGRWRFESGHFRSSWHADSQLRKMMCMGTTASLKASGRVHVDQSAVWDHVDGLLSESQAASPTNAYHAMYEKWDQEYSEYEAALNVPDNVSGVGVEVDGILQSVDLFDKPATLRQMWPKLAKCYITSALRPRPAEGQPTEVKEFLRKALSSPFESFTPVGIGTTVRMATQEADGGALLCDGLLVHLSLFANTLPKPSDEEAPSPQAKVPVEPESPAGSKPTRGRSWWKMWR